MARNWRTTIATLGRNGARLSDLPGPLSVTLRFYHVDFGHQGIGLWTYTQTIGLIIVADWLSMLVDKSLYI